MSIKSPYEISLDNVLPGALEEEKVMTRHTTRRMTHLGMPCLSCQHIAEDYDEETSEDSNNCGSTPSTSTSDMQSEFLSFTNSADLLAIAMITSITSLEEQMATLTGMVESLLQKMQQQDESITQISGKIPDEEHRARATEAALKEV
ncbi:hypothetical protein LIER_29426 [Lithospermum erythrorhizon]|uniref:Uncharacterized protein n=1 Tax=Lithospermum erythrorhizon TaxID=34254 RepID=A0AAV3RPC6_LITER